VKPVPEEEWMAKKQELEAASVTQESLSPPDPEPEKRAETPPAQGEDPGERSRPRRRRARRAGTPTRLIGTGKKSDDED